MKGYDIGNNQTVIRMATMNISGNVIPLEWFKHIKRPNGKPFDVAIMLLADIVYWYRPIEVRDETTGALIGYRKKFAADRLQRSYSAFADLYGYTKLQVRDALDYLNEKKIICIEFRHPTINGQKLGNVLYIGLNYDELMKITHPLPTLKSRGCEDISQDPPDFKVDTNTEITTDSFDDDDGIPAPLSTANVFKLYEQEIGPLTPMISESLIEAEKNYPFEWIKLALETAVLNNKRSWGYAAAILRRWKVDGFQSDSRPKKTNGKNGQRPATPAAAMPAWTPETLRAAWAAQEALEMEQANV